MHRPLIRLAAACLAALLCVAAVSADPLPAPRFPDGNILKNVEFSNGLNNWTVANTNGKDKVKCAAAGYNSDCGFRFIGKKPSEATILSQKITPASAGAGARAAIVVNGEAYTRSLSGTSCLAFTLTVKFNNPEVETLKDTYSDCGSGVLEAWVLTPEFGPNTSFGENSYKKITLKIKHTGVGEWMIDAFNIWFEDK